MQSAGKNILVVDDEIKIREVIESLLNSKGYQVFTAENGTDALAIFDKENIALVVFELISPVSVFS